MTVDVALAALCVGFAQFEHQPRALFAVLALAPFAAWTLYVHAVTAGDQTRWLSWPFAGIVMRTLHR